MASVDNSMVILFGVVAKKSILWWNFIIQHNNDNRDNADNYNDVGEEITMVTVIEINKVMR